MEKIDIAVLENFNRLELSASREKIEELWQKSLKARVRSRKAIDRVVFGELFKIGDYDDIYFRRAYVKENFSDFKEGESVRIHCGSPKHNVSKGTVYSIDRGGDLILGFSSFDLRSAQNIIQEKEYILDKDIVDMEKIHTTALLRLQNWEDRDRLLKILNGEYAVNYLLRRSQEVEEVLNPFLPRLNEAQREAIINAVSSDAYYLIQGPPGTGKTFVLAIIALILTKVFKERVLITAPTHLAINNALAKCAELGISIDSILKVGQRYNKEGLKTKEGEILSVERLSNNLFQITESTITGISPFHLHTTRAKGLFFDTVIIDEAGQMNASVAAMALCCAKRYILIGDHKQMAPIFSSDEHPAYIQRSIFEHLFQHGNRTILNTTYRLNDEITDYVSSFFYENELSCFSGNMGRRLTPSIAIWGEKLASVHYFQHHRKGSTVFDQYEAKVVVDIIKKYIESGIPANEIAVVTPFRMQGRMIRALLYQFDESHAKEITVDTVEKMQGQERDIVIISMVSSDRDFIQEIESFYFQPNRLNVAITRAKNQVIILSSDQVLDMTSTDKEVHGAMQLYSQLLRKLPTIQLI